MDVLDKKIGSEGEVDLKIEQAMLVLEGKYLGKQAEAGSYVKVHMDLILDKLAEKIPGVIDDAIIAVAKEALKKL